MGREDEGSVNKKIIAWKWIPADMKMRHRYDGRKFKTGVTQRLSEDRGKKEDSIPMLCRTGFHACRELLQTAEFIGYGSRLALVELSGNWTEYKKTDVAYEAKVCATRIKVLANFDSEKIDFDSETTLHIAATSFKNGGTARWRHISKLLRQNMRQALSARGLPSSILPAR